MLLEDYFLPFIEKNKTLALFVWIKSVLKGRAKLKKASTCNIFSVRKIILSFKLTSYKETFRRQHNYKLMGRVTR